MDTFVNDTVQFTIDAGIDLSGYSTLQIKYRKPDGTYGCWTAAICGTDNNCMTYTCVAGDLDQVGDWLLQALASDVGVALHGRPTELTVLAPLIATCPP